MLSDALQAVAIVVALVSLWVAIYAVRRDRAVLRVYVSHAMAGRWGLDIRNVGGRPVRLVRVWLRRNRWNRFGQRIDCGWLMPSGRGPDEFSFPFVLAPGDQRLLRLQEGREQLIPAGFTTWLLEDARGQLHVAKEWPPHSQYPRWRRIGHRVTSGRIAPRSWRYLNE